MATKLIRDLSESSGYWGASFLLSCFPDVHLVCDAPIGCFNLVGTAVPDYTDAIPHMANMTPTVLREQEITMLGSGGALQRTLHNLEERGLSVGKQVIVISTAPAEQIGSHHTDLLARIAPGVRFYQSHSLEEEEWTGRDRCLGWIWDEFGFEAEATGIAPEPGSVNIIGPSYGCFNSPSDLHEIKRLIEGAGGTVNIVYPYAAKLSDTANLARGSVNVQMYAEFGGTLAAKLGQPTLRAPIGIEATTRFVRELARLLGTEEQAEAFIRREKKTTLAGVWDVWRGPQGDWFGTMDAGIVAGRTYAEGLRDFLGDELGMKIRFVAGRPLMPDDPDNIAVRGMIHAKQPAFVFGSMNEHIYLAEANAKQTHFIPASFPCPIVRRALGTPFMGYSGAMFLVQELVNRFYDSLFNFLPVETAQGRAEWSASRAGTMPWHADATARLNTLLEGVPFIARISATRNVRTAAEDLARARGEAQVLVADVDSSFESTKNRQGN